MGLLRVIDAGLLATVQDLGRPGHAHIGVPVGGAVDPLSLRIGNRLVGNPDGAAAIELTLTGGRFEFEHDAVVALVGGRFEAAVRDLSGRARRTDHGMTIPVRPGEHIVIDRNSEGARTYLCIAGGISVPSVLGSASTHLGAGFGGVEGRGLRRGDRIEFGTPPNAPLTGQTRVVGSHVVQALAPRCSIRAVQTPRAASIAPSSLAAFWSAEFRVAQSSNRVGVRLEGGLAPSARPSDGRMTTEGMTWGAVQFPPDGNPIILLCDHPTTGGYPVVACVASVDFPALGQLRPGDTVRFEQVSRSEALGLGIRREDDLNRHFPSPHDPGRAQLFPGERGSRVRSETINRTGCSRTGARRAASIDLNADLGESSEPARLAIDRDLLKIVTSANVACGELGHAGDERTMSEIVGESLARGVAIGAHPGYPDRPNFGRVAMNLAPEQVEATVRDQLTALAAVAAARGRHIEHVKPHGALYHAANLSPAIAAAIARAAEGFGESIVLVGQARSLALEVWRSMGFATAAEAFADRRYEDDGTLRARSHPGALISDPAQAAAQAVQIAVNHRVVTESGREVDLHAQTICIHSDTPGALAAARVVRSALESAGVEIRALVC